MIRQAYYYLSPDTESDLKIDTLPLAVNCAGMTYCPAHFKFSKIRHDWQVILVTNGTVMLNMNNNLYTVETNGYVIIEPETFYVQTAGNDFCSYYWTHFSGTDVLKILADLNIKSNTVYTTQITNDITSSFSQLFKEFLIKDEKFNYITSSLLTQILSYLSRSGQTLANYRYIGDSINYIYNNFNKDIDIKILADMEHMSVARYRSMFKSQLGVTLVDFITSLRMDNACFYLKRTSMSIAEIAYSVGYASQFYFSRIFKQKKGISPREYREKGR